MSKSVKELKLIPQAYVDSESQGDNIMLSSFLGREVMLLLGKTTTKEDCDLPQSVTLRCDSHSNAGPIDITITIQVDSPLTRSKREREEGNVQ